MENGVIGGCHYIDLSHCERKNIEVHILGDERFQIKDFPEVKQKWLCGIDAIDENNDLFHSWKDGGMRVAKDSFVYVGTTYKMLYRNGSLPIHVNGVKLTNCGTLTLNTHIRHVSFNVMELIVEEITNEAVKFLSAKRYILKNRCDEITPIWPPAIWKGRDLIYKDNTAYLMHNVKNGNIKGYDVYVLDGNSVVKIPEYKIIQLNQSTEIVKINTGDSKPVMLNGKLNPMRYDVIKDCKAFAYDSENVEITVLDKNDNIITEVIEKIPADGVLKIISNVPFSTAIFKGNFVVNSKFISGRIEDVRWGVFVKINCGAWGKYLISFVKKESRKGELNWVNINKSLMHISGVTTPLDSRILRLLYNIQKVKDSNATVTYNLINRWAVSNAIPVNALKWIYDMEQYFN